MKTIKSKKLPKTPKGQCRRIVFGDGRRRYAKPSW